MTKAKLAGLDGKRNEPIFPRKHTEPAGEVSTEAPATSGSFKPARGLSTQGFCGWFYQKRDELVFPLNYPSGL